MHRPTAEARAVLGKARARAWKSDAEREALLDQIAALRALEAGDVAWMAVDSDPSLRQRGLSLLERFPYEDAERVLYSSLVSRTEAVRRAAIEALAALAGPSFTDKLPELLGHSDSAVVHVALDWLRRNPAENNLTLIAEALKSASPGVRRKAFAIVESTSSPRVVPFALRGLEDEDEQLRFRAVQLLTKFPDDSAIGPLLRHCHLDSTRIQEAAITALSPLLARADIHWNEDLIPLLSDANPRVRQLASRILRTQDPARVAEAFLHSYQDTYGPARDRALEGLRELGPQYIPAFLDQDADPDPRIAALASAVAVTIRSPEVVPHCIRYLEGDDWWLRDRAAHALGELRDERGLEPLVKMLGDPESNLSAAAALGAWATPRALPALLEAYKRGTKDLRLEILDAFARILDRRVPGLLSGIVKADPDPLVRDKASRLLETLSGEAASDGLSAGSREFTPHDFAASPEPTLPDLLRHARAVSASDLHLSSGTIPHVRVNGQLLPLPLPPSAPQQMENWIRPILSPEHGRAFEERQQIDFCHKDSALGRFRTNVFLQRKGMSAVFRLVPFEVPNLADIGLPESLWEITTYSQGLILVTGPAGCGKTTTLAALVDRINETERCHILTIEDPIEYVHGNKDSLVNQREIPTHSRSFARALRQSLREDPDVILVGEMRDLETISLAITAAETGHLVLATLHTTTASSTVDRIINAFPPDQQGQIRQMISDSLKAVISQSLLPRRDGTGRVAAWEILRNTPAVAGLIREAKTFQIPTAIQTGSGTGMMLMDMSLLKLVQDGTVDARVAYDRALRKEAFETLIEEGNVA
ncbi:MAG TPA: PilT/PilU family type 4a pilus ATPase [Thermoanaerobaculia bacterium]|jgi:twitching motility protein PilT|nr:PilT/PilU family type 4a pilus ATPase [Thermoanaerobaculia bacterium]